jgi:hypothetical protein
MAGLLKSLEYHVRRVRQRDEVYAFKGTVKRDFMASVF